MQCQAKSKRSGQQCKRPAVVGMRVCYIHGGASPRGLASGRYKTGKYSKYAPQRLLERYHESLKDTELLALRDDIALVDSRIEDILKRVDSGEAGAIWNQARGAYAALRNAMADQDQLKIMGALKDLDSCLGRGVADWAAWDELLRLMESRRKLVESEQKRLIAMNQMVTTEQAMILVTALIDVVRRNVTDRATLAAIDQDITRLITRPTPAGNP